MKIRNLAKVILFGMCAGFLLGLVQSIQNISSQRYFHYSMYRLILFELSENMNKGIIYSLMAVASVLLLILAISFVWRKWISPFFDIRIKLKKKLTPVIRGFLYGLLVTYIVFQIFRFALDPAHNLRSFLGQSLIAAVLLFLIIQLEKINLKILKARLAGILSPNGLKTAAFSLLLIIVLINVWAFSQKFFGPSGPNVLLIVADALRPDHLGCYGYDRHTSFHIDQFASSSLVFKKAMSNAPWTKPSMGSVFTSLYPNEHQAFFWTDNLSDACLTMAEVFRNRNYATFAVQTNPSITENHNFRQGFRHYREIALGKAELVTSLFNTWLKKHTKRPFFAYLHYMDTHVPYNAPKEFSRIFGLEEDSLFKPGEFKTVDVRVLGEIGLSQQDKRNLVNLYDGAIKYFDNHFQKIIDNLKRLKILKKTIIILTSDHGEEFWEHGGFAHGHTLYNEVLHVPLIISYPSHLPPKQIESQIQLLDLFPSLLALSRVKNKFEFRGYNLIPALLNNREIDEEIFFEGILYGAERKGILKNEWKLIKNIGKKYGDTFDPLGNIMKYRYPEYKKDFELYNIQQDFQEAQNMIARHPRTASQLKGLLRLFNIASTELQRHGKTNIKKKLEDLKSLGYVK